MFGRFWLSSRAVMLAFAVGLTFCTVLPGQLNAQDPAPTAAETPVAEAEPVAEAAASEAPVPPTAEEVMAKLSVGIDTIWVMVCGMLVFFMNLGFGCVESGFCRAKNCVNILSKNFIVFAACSIGFWFIGWDLMFGAGDGEFIGNSGSLMVQGADNSPKQATLGYEGVYSAIAWSTVPLWCKFFFQLVFAATAATIVSGAVAERIKYHAFIIFCFIMAVAIYPVTGHWIWGFGYLAAKWNFWDFAGSTVVHSVGGWAALTGAIILGPRIGKFGPGGKINAIPGHNMTAAFIGCLVLWFGWFGFNPGSTMSVAADGGAMAAISAVNTNMAAAFATMTATATAWILLGKPDIGMTLNGCLAGLVAITAPAYFTSPACSAIIGAISGVTVVLAVLMFDRLRIDDPVGAISVHLVHGVFGTLCVGLFSTTDLSATPITGGPKAGLFFGGGTEQLVAQAVGVVMVGGYVLVVSSIAWLALKYTIGIRVSESEEIEGLDLGEHGNEAYHGFVMQSSGN
ncbi:MAG: ammonium transporter [Planctomyces sp.]|nr:ammonium transporter [Planctomyces sp.]